MGRPLTSEGTKFYDFDIDPKGASMDDMDSLFSRYPEWTENKREIRLAGLLNEGSKILFEIESVWIPIHENAVEWNISGYSQSMGYIESMAIKVMDEKILEIKAKVIPTNKALIDILNEEIRPVISMISIGGKFATFYMSFPDEAA